MLPTKTRSGINEYQTLHKKHKTEGNEKQLPFQN